MENIKSILKYGASKIILGLLIGLGFGLSFLALYYYVSLHMQAQLLEMFKENESKINSVELLAHEDQKIDDALVVIGSLMNNSEKVIDSVTLEAEFYENGIFVDECTEYVSGLIKPSALENFKLSCGNCSSSYIAPVYDSYTLKVTSVSN